MKFDNQLRYAVQIIDTYQGETPLNGWLKDFFRVHPVMGSRDRRIVSAMVYSYFRLGHAIKQQPANERILAGLFLCNDQPIELLGYFRPAWNERVTLVLAEKIAFYQKQPEGAGFRIADIFPWKEELSPDVDHEAFCLSFLRQPDLFLRIRPGQEQTVRHRLGQAGFDLPDASDPSRQASGEFIPPFTLRLPNGFKVEEYLTPDLEVVIQDYSSQRVAEFLQPGSMALAVAAPTVGKLPAAPIPQFFWDACAASGGKSILAHDLYPDMEILVSDIREPILRNLRARFKTAGIKKYHAFLTDLSKQAAPASAVNAELLLADVPCTGSGTWGRTPEDLWFFDPKKIRRYSDLQRNILTNIAPHLAADASLVYCTCSVFKKENEEMAAFIRDAFGLQEQARENLKGYDQRADTLFAARYTR